ncbi:MAG TPA: hypothetical protein VIQ78_11350, partial [Terrimesophilobacter sp.]|uniref:hypothetical protein n=1 Tax=Terrimesophilobacter sp. TaxID=2906435 RepID=UPI002F94A104
MLSSRASAFPFLLSFVRLFLLSFLLEVVEGGALGGQGSWSLSGVDVGGWGQPVLVVAPADVPVVVVEEHVVVAAEEYSVGQVGVSA